MNTELFGELHEQEEYGLFGKEHQRQQCTIHSVGRSFSSGQKLKVELEDGTVWNAEVSEENTVIVDCTPEYMSYYEWNYGGGNEFPTAIDNEYQFEDVKVLGVL